MQHLQKKRYEKHKEVTTHTVTDGSILIPSRICNRPPNAQPFDVQHSSTISFTIGQYDGRSAVST